MFSQLLPFKTALKALFLYVQRFFFRIDSVSQHREQKRKVVLNGCLSLQAVTPLANVCCLLLSHFLPTGKQTKRCGSVARPALPYCRVPLISVSDYRNVIA